MNCSKCGGTLHPYLTLVNGDRLFQCQTALTAMRQTPRGFERQVLIEHCHLVYDEAGALFNGVADYMDGGKVKTKVINKGKVN